MVFLLIGLAGLYLGRSLEIGRAAQMGPGYFPALLSGLIIITGLIIAGRAFVIEGLKIEPIRLRPLSVIVVAIALFGLLIDRAGLAISAAVVTILAAYARKHVNLAETLLLSCGLTIFVVGVFIYGLSQPLRTWWF